MSYSSIEEVKIAWADISDTEIGTDRVSQAIDYVDGIIDSYCNKMYTVPFGSTPAAIKGIAINLTLYYCKYWKNPRMISVEDKTKWETALQDLEKIRKGELTIPGLSQKQLASSTQEDSTPVFNEDGQD